MSSGVDNGAVISSPPVSTVLLKLPSFWNENADAWFRQAEAQFVIQNVTAEDTKYCYVDAALNSDTAVHVAPLLDSLDTSSRYSSLESFSLDTYGLSGDEPAQQFFYLNNLGNRKPSEVMDYMIRLHGGETPGFLLNFAFKRLLPPLVCHAISSFPAKDFRALSHEADHSMVDFRDQRNAPFSSVVSPRDNSPVPPTSSSALSSSTNVSLTPPLADMSAVSRPRRHFPPHRNAHHDKLHCEDRCGDSCYYHGNFSNNAHQFRPPCSCMGNSHLTPHH